MKRLRLAVLVPRVKRSAKDNMPMELTSEGDLEPHDPASYGMLFQKRGNNGSDPQIREEIRMTAASSWARISWPCPTKFERPNLILWRSHEIRSFDDHNTEAPHSALDTGAADGPNFAAMPRNSPVVVPENFGAPQIRPRNSRVFLTPYLQPYSEVASGYSPGNCGGATTISGLEIPERFVGPYLHVDGVDSPLVVE